jgi:DNA-binding response OmpR family regulator
MGHRILLTAAEPRVRRLLLRHLAEAGFDVSTATDGPTAMALLAEAPPDLLIVEQRLPDLDGLEVCRATRRLHRTPLLPVLVLTGNNREEDRIAALEAGADALVSKPFSPRELVLRVMAVLRRTARGQQHGARDADKRIRVGPVVIEPDGPRVLVRGQSVQFTATEFRLLVALARAPGRVYGRAELLAAICNRRGTGLSRTVDTHIRRLRARLAGAEDLIETVRGLGYRCRRFPD